jgi:hypothetical protein
MIGKTRRQQAFGLLPVQVKTFGLSIRAVRPTDAGPFIPVQPEPCQALIDPFLRMGKAPFKVGIFQPEYETPAACAGKQVVEKRCSCAADV